MSQIQCCACNVIQCNLIIVVTHLEAVIELRLLYSELNVWTLDLAVVMRWLPYGSSDCWGFSVILFWWLVYKDLNRVSNNVKLSLTLGACVRITAVSLYVCVSVCYHASCYIPPQVRRHWVLCGVLKLFVIDTKLLSFIFAVSNGMHVYSHWSLWRGTREFPKAQ